MQSQGVRYSVQEIESDGRKQCDKVGMESSPNFSKCFPKSNHNIFYLKSQSSQKNSPNIWAIFLRKLIAKNFLKPANPVALSTLFHGSLFCNLRLKFEMSNLGKTKLGFRPDEG